jgi:Bacterial mobilisation protein (MobC)
MGRYERTYAGEKRTAIVTLKLTPSERDELEAAALGQGAPTLSAYARELLFRRSAAVVAATRRNPEAAALLDELRTTGLGLSNSGNNLNQIARHLNTTGELRDWGELRDALEDFRATAQAVKRASARVLDL